MLKLDLVAISLFATTAFPAPVYASGVQIQPNQSYYCGTGTVFLLNDATEETLKKIYETCKIGDVIGIGYGTGAGTAVRRICDFSKEILTLEGRTVCVLAPLRPVR
jgi:hypothetical protein